MFAILGFIIVLALAIALAPIILGVIGSMLALFLTAVLYIFAGCPDNTPRPKSAAEQAADDAPYQQLLEYERQDAERAAKHAAEKAQKAGKAAARKARESIERGLLDAQKRVREEWHHAEEP